MLKKLQYAYLMLFVSSLHLGCSASPSTIQTAISHTQTALPLSTTIPTVSPPPPIFVSPPVSNSVYFGTAEGKNVIFVTENHRQDLLKNQDFETSPYLGWLYYGMGYQLDIFNFNNLENPKLLFSIPDLNQWHEVKYDLDQPYRKYISGTRNTPPNLFSFVYVVDLDSGNFQEVWTWEGYPAHISYVYDEFLELSISWCYTCDYVSQPNIIILNTLSGRALELGGVGNVIVNLENSLVSFQYLTAVEIACEDDSPCVGIQYDPIGEVFIESLP